MNRNVIVGIVVAVLCLGVLFLVFGDDGTEDANSNVQHSLEGE